MENRRILDTLRLCGKIGIEDEYYKVLCESLLDITDILRLYMKYKKEDRLNIVVYILSFMVIHIKDIDKLRKIYNELLNIFEIGLKYDIISHDRRSLEKKFYLRLSYINRDMVERLEENVDIFDSCMEALRKLRIVYVRAFENNNVTLNGVEYKIVADRDSTMYLDNKGERYKEYICLIRLGLNKMSMLKFDKEKIKRHDIIDILRNNKDCIYVVRADYMIDYRW